MRCSTRAVLCQTARRMNADTRRQPGRDDPTKQATTHNQHLPQHCCQVLYALGTNEAPKEALACPLCLYGLQRSLHIVQPLHQLHQHLLLQLVLL